MGPTASRGIVPEVSQLEDMLLALKLAALSYTEDKVPQPLEQIVSAIGDYDTCEEFEWKLTPLLQYMGYQADRLFSHNRGTCQGYIAHNGEDIVLAYRGTDSAADWFANLDISTVPFDPARDARKGRRCCLIRLFVCIFSAFARCVRCIFSSFCFCCSVCRQRGKRAHKGFYKAFLASVRDIDEVVLPFLQTEEPKRVIITGHSMGGALATGACFYLLSLIDFVNTPHTLIFVTAGQPRFGNSEFCEALDQKFLELEALDRCFSMRIRNDRDAVPHMPSSLAGYRHAGRNVHVTAKGHVLLDPVEMDVNDKGSIKEAFSDHLPVNYLDSIQKAVWAALERRKALPPSPGPLPKSLRDAGRSSFDDETSNLLA